MKPRWYRAWGEGRPAGPPVYGLGMAAWLDAQHAAEAARRAGDRDWWGRCQLAAYVALLVDAQDRRN